MKIPIMADRMADSYAAETRGVRIIVAPRFEPERSDVAHGRFFWTYAVRIENNGHEDIQLVSRHWVITDGRNRFEEVRGPGVVGKQPLLAPGESFEYISGCPLGTPSGAMHGKYQMVTGAGEAFEAVIPAFSLHLPGAGRRPN